MQRVGELTMSNNNFVFTSKSEYVYNILKERIMSGQLRPGQICKIVDLAEEFGVSRTPVTEAVKILENQGFVDLLPSVGFEIKTLSIKEIYEILMVRGALEALALKLGMEKATPDSYKSLRTILGNCQKAVEEKRIDDYRKFNEEFHFKMYEMANIPTLTGLLRNLWNHEGLYLEVLKNEPKKILDLLNEHYQLIDVMESGDKSAIDPLVQEHIDSCHKILAEHIVEVNR